MYTDERWIPANCPFQNASEQKLTEEQIISTEISLLQKKNNKFYRNFCFVEDYFCSDPDALIPFLVRTNRENSESVRSQENQPNTVKIINRAGVLKTFDIPKAMIEQTLNKTQLAPE